MNNNDKLKELKTAISLLQKLGDTTSTLYKSLKKEYAQLTNEKSAAADM